MNLASPRLTSLLLALARRLVALAQQRRAQHREPRADGRV